MKKLSAEVRVSLEAVLRIPQRQVDLRRLGLLDHDIQRLLRNKSLQRAHHRYIDGALDAPAATAICAQAAHPGSVISHHTAAVLRDLRTWTDREREDRPPPGATWLTYAPGDQRRNQKRSDLVLRRATLTPPDLQRNWLPKQDDHPGDWRPARDEVDGVAGGLLLPIRRTGGSLLTSDARTVVDLARELPFAEALVTADHALAVSVTREELEEVVRRQSRWPGIRQARVVLAFADPRSESVLESIARARFAEAGLPAPVLQATFWDGTNWMLERVDLWWPEFRTVGEADGLAKFDAPTSAERRYLLRRNRERDHRLSDRDLEVVHFGWEDAVLRPDELAARFRAAFARGLRRTGPPPTWRALDAALYPHHPAPAHTTTFG